MSEEEGREPGEEPVITVTPRPLAERSAAVMERLLQMFEQRFPEFTRPVTPAVPAEKRILTPEEEKVVDEFLEWLDPEIKELAEDIIREETKDKLKAGYKIDVLKRAIKEKKKPKLKRKKGCIFIQIGEGTPKDPIDEILVAAT